MKVVTHQCICTCEYTGILHGKELLWKKITNKKSVMWSSDTLPINSVDSVTVYSLTESPVYGHVAE